MLRLPFQRGLLFMCLTCSLASAARAAAALSVGDKPEFSFKDIDGQDVNIADYRGKVVVVIYWATYCPTCKKESPDWVKLHEELGPQGVQVLGIVADAKSYASKVRDTVKERGFLWPNYHEAADASQEKLSEKWDIHTFSTTVLIDPDGAVVWKGLFHESDAPLKKALKQNPPRLVSADVVASANKTLDDVESLLKSDDALAAIQKMSTVSAEASGDGKTAARQKKIAEELSAAGEKLLAEVDPLIDEKKYPQASAELAALVKAFGNSDAGKSAKAKLEKLTSIPEARASIDSEKKNAAATAELEAAKKLQAAKKDEAAYLKFKSIAKTFPAAPAATEAAAAVAEYEKDPALVKRVEDSASGTKAKAALSMAQSYAKSGKGDLAKKKYQEVIDQFPGTTFADTAKTELEKLR